MYSLYTLYNMPLTVLVETNVSGSLSEALTANVQAVLSDQTRVRSANSALSRALTVVSWVGEPNVFVSHIAKMLVCISRTGLALHGWPALICRRVLWTSL